MTYNPKNPSITGGICIDDNLRASIAKRYLSLIDKYKIEALRDDINHSYNKSFEESPPLASPSATTNLAKSLVLNNLHNSPEHYVELYEERAAIAEYDGGLCKKEAGQLAFKETLNQYFINHHELTGKLQKFSTAINYFKSIGLNYD